MKYIKKILSLALMAISILSIAAPATAVIGIPAGSTAYTIKGDVAVRSTPTTNISTNIIKRVNTGTKVHILESAHSLSAFYKVSITGLTSGAYIRADCLGQAAPGGGGSGEKPTEGKISVSNGWVNVRSGPGTNYASIARMYNNERLTYFSGATYSGNGYTWYKCKGSKWHGDGYIVTKYVFPSSGTSPSVPGVSGKGPNSKVSAQDIRNGTGKWIKDLKTKHPQIIQMQNMLNDAVKNGEMILDISMQTVFLEVIQNIWFPPSGRNIPLT